MRYSSIISITAERLLIAAAMAVLALLISVRHWVYSVDQAIYDGLARQVVAPVVKGLLIVAIDGRSLLELGRWPWRRNVHAQLVDKLAQAGAKAIAFDVLFAEPDLENPEHDRDFARAMAEMGNVVLAVHMERTHFGGQILEVLPPPQLIQAAASLGHVHVEHDSDGVCRGVFLKEGLGEAFWPHLAVSLQRVVGGTLSDPLPGLASPEAAPASPFVIARDYFNLIPLVGPSPSIPSVSYTDIIHDRIPRRNLEGKIFLVGAMAKGIGDVVATSFGTMDGVEYQANVFNSLRAQATVTPVAMSWHAVVSTVAVFLLIMSGMRASPRQYLLMTIGFSIAVVASATILLAWFKLWFAPMAIILPLLLFYPVWSWRRLEQALRFLRRELERVQADLPRARQSHPINIEQQLRFLARLVGPIHWRLSDASGAVLAASQELPSGKVNSKVLLNSGHELDNFQVEWSWPQEPSAVMEEVWAANLTSFDEQRLDKVQEVPMDLVSQSIGQLRTANKLAAESQAFVNRCFENLQDAVIVADPIGNVTFANARARSTFAINSDPYPPLEQCLASINIEHGWDNWLQRAVSEQHELYAEVGTTTDERQYFMQLASLHWQSENIDTLLFSFTDITALKESERVRSEALHFLSHDLRSPIVSILALLEQFKNTSDADILDHQPVQQFLTEIETYAQKNLSFAESFLQLARAEIAGDTKFDLVDMHSVLDNAMMMARVPSRAKNINITINREYEDFWVWGDGELLERLFVNLLTNAIKYSDPGNDVKVTLGREDDELIVAIKDRGIGIPASQIGHIFERFQRGSHTASISGAGLGLYFVQLVANQHGGRVQADSVYGEGACFTVFLPLYEEVGEPGV